MELIAAAVMVVGLIGTFIIRFRLRKGIGRRAIQAMTIILVVPATIILALERILVSETTAAILARCGRWLRIVWSWRKGNAGMRTRQLAVWMRRSLGRSPSKWGLSCERSLHNPKCCDTR
jgi:hypothetical protein